uniref:Uncharacterized protein n=1 Tax=Amphimedon queenslandica TaxID=400682 RepID=A0A1X7UQT2_AMPQE
MKLLFIEINYKNQTNVTFVTDCTKLASLFISYGYFKVSVARLKSFIYWFIYIFISNILPGMIDDRDDGSMLLATLPLTDSATCFPSSSFPLSHLCYATLLTQIHRWDIIWDQDGIVEEPIQNLPEYLETQKLVQIFGRTHFANSVAMEVDVLIFLVYGSFSEVWIATNKRSMSLNSFATPLRYLRRKGLGTLLSKTCAKKNMWLALRHVIEENRSVKIARIDALQLRKDEDTVSWTSLANLMAATLHRAP